MRILLTGKVAQKPLEQKIASRKIKIKVSHPLMSPHGDAELLSISSLNGETVPYVGNNLAPLPVKDGY
jgi:hypothetical protein